MKIFAFLSIAIMLFGCSETDLPTSVDQEHNAKNSLDWQGVYQGIFPCADCEGIETTLTLIDDGSFVLQRVYQEGDTDYVPPAISGMFEWDKTGSLISLIEEQQKDIFFVGEGFVKMYDDNGEPIESQFDYTLEQIRRFDNTEVKDIEVASQWADCEGIGSSKCLLVREKGSDKWVLHYSPIQGFDYEPGYFYHLKIAQTKIDNPPTDSSSIAWSLIATLNKVSK